MTNTASSSAKRGICFSRRSSYSLLATRYSLLATRYYPSRPRNHRPVHHGSLKAERPFVRMSRRFGENGVRPLDLGGRGPERRVQPRNLSWMNAQLAREAETTASAGVARKRLVVVDVDR